MNFTIPGLEGYFGSKGSAGVAQAIINIIPPHDTFIVPFLGHCAITRTIKPASYTILLEKDKVTASFWAKYFTLPNEKIYRELAVGFIHEKGAMGSYELINACGISFLENFAKFIPLGYANFLWEVTKKVVYCDPPYVWEKRTSKNKYRHDWEENDHLRFLQAVKKFPEKVIISHYENDLYNKHLKGWNTIKYNSMTRAGEQREEIAYFNYEPPTKLHDYSFYGGDYRKREDFSRKAKRMVNKWANWSEADRNYFAQHLKEKGFI